MTKTNLKFEMCTLKSAENPSPLVTNHKPRTTNSNNIQSVPPDRFPQKPPAESRRPQAAVKFLHSKFYILHSIQRAFTLVELMIVVAVLGILAAIVLPEFQGHTQQAKEAAAKDNLRILREAIERYAINHNGVPPGYNGNNPSSVPSGFLFLMHLKDDYLYEVPVNPFNNSSTVNALANGETFPEIPCGSDGWIYQAENKTIKLNYAGTDSKGKKYYDY